MFKYFIYSFFKIFNRFSRFHFTVNYIVCFSRQV